MFLKANKDNSIIAEVIGGRKRENGLVVPCLYKCWSNNKKIAEILIKEVSNSSEKYQHMDIILKGKLRSKNFISFFSKNWTSMILRTQKYICHLLIISQT